MQDNTLYESFNFLLNRNKNKSKKIEIKDDKILFEIESDLANNIKRAIFFLFPYALNILLVYMLRERYSRTESIFITFLTFGLVLLANYYITTYKVIDFKNRLIYDLNQVFNIRRRKNIISFDEIMQVGNNVVPQIKNPGDRYGLYEGLPVEEHTDTQCYHKYYLCFLLNNNKIVNFYNFGIFQKDYIDSMKTAENISYFLNKDLAYCNSEKTLYLEAGRLEEKSISIFDVYQEEKEIENKKFNITPFLVISFVILIILNLICFGLYL